MRTGQRICAVVFCVAASGSVCADETGTGKAVFYGVAGAAAGIFDVGFTAYDLTHLSSVASIPRSVGIVEVAGALPQVGVAIYVAINPPPTAGVRGLSVAWAVWASLLSAHGIWVIASGNSPDDNPALAPRAALSRCLDPSPPLPQGRQQTMIWSMVRRF